jgi:hypothetical protein
VGVATWLDRYAEELGVPPLAEDEIRDLLALARDVAHGVERRYAPLSTFLAGFAVGAGGDREARLAVAIADARRLLDEHDDPPPGT